MTLQVTLQILAMLHPNQSLTQEEQQTVRNFWVRIHGAFMNPSRDFDALNFLEDDFFLSVAH